MADLPDMGGIDEIRRILGSKPRPVGWAERRQRIEEVATIDPPPPEVSFTPATVGTVPVEWSAAPGSDAGKIVLYFHGGGYCSGSILSHRGLVARIGQEAGTRTLAVGYRLAPENPFPAALDDALAAYHHLLAEGVRPGGIVLAGDSAGGGLSLALLQKLRDGSVPLPGCAWLISPWSDLAMTGASLDTKDQVDPLIHRGYLQELAAAYLHGADPDGPLVSPLHGDLHGLPPVLIQVGSAETLLDDSVRLAGVLGASDVAVTLEVWPGMIHAWPLWAARVPEGAAAIRAASSFLRCNLGS